MRLNQLQTLPTLLAFLMLGTACSEQTLSLEPLASVPTNLTPDGGVSLGVNTLDATERAVTFSWDPSLDAEAYTLVINGEEALAAPVVETTVTLDLTLAHDPLTWTWQVVGLTAFDALTSEEATFQTDRINQECTGGPAPTISVVTPAPDTVVTRGDQVIVAGAITVPFDSVTVDYFAGRVVDVADDSIVDAEAPITATFNLGADQYDWATTINSGNFPGGLYRLELIAVDSCGTPNASDYLQFPFEISDVCDGWTTDPPTIDMDAPAAAAIGDTISVSVADLVLADAYVAEVDTNPAVGIFSWEPLAIDQMTRIATSVPNQLGEFGIRIKAQRTNCNDTQWVESTVYTVTAGSGFFQVASPTSENLHDIVYDPLSTRMYAVGANGVIIRSLNQGLNWEAMNSQILTDLNRATILGNNAVLAVGANGETTQAINTTVWSQFPAPPPYLNDIFFGITHSGSGGQIAVGAGGAVLTRSTSSDVWTARITGFAFDLRDVAYVTFPDAFAVTDNGRWLHSADQGATWADFDLPDIGAIVMNSLACEGGTVCLAVGDNGTLMRTADANLGASATWGEVVSATLAGNLSDVTFVDATTAVIVGATGQVWDSTDAGATWTERYDGTAGALNGTTYLGVDDGVSVGDAGLILVQRP